MATVLPATGWDSPSERPGSLPLVQAQDRGAESRAVMSLYLLTSCLQSTIAGQVLVLYVCHVIESSPCPQEVETVLAGDGWGLESICRGKQRWR